MTDHSELIDRLRDLSTKVTRTYGTDDDTMRAGGDMNDVDRWWFASQSAADAIEALATRSALMAELMNDVLGVAPDRAQGQVWALNLSSSSSVGLPTKFLALWDAVEATDD